ncbi:hypothetical protein M426DRAFT_73129 [Hypoxylon sp. CI-4A]|nr:hypothetical protein M426DRAFT_73129 [Hypoxylon sp. CI-4A]
MDMDDMGDMDGMSMGNTDFTSVNKSYAKGYWYIVAAIIVLFLVIRTINFVLHWLRLRRAKTHSVQFPSKPAGPASKVWATLTAIGREMSYPQLYIPTRGLSWMTPPPMGRVLILLAYWAVIIYMMTKEAIVFDYDFFERVAYRSAWVTVTQLPLLYLLASRANVIAFITGTSYEKLNWLHRWVARAMLVSATVHGFHFWAEWVRANIVDMELDMMSMVKYGFGAWGILLWMNITSFKPLRTMAYEIFVAQHILAAIIFLWVVYVHVPASARYNVWFAIASLCFDRAFRLGLLICQNVKLRPNRSGCEGGQWIGHQTQLSAVGESMTVLTIKDVHFKWQTGQHLYLWLPRVGPFEAHPYTIASAHQMPNTCVCNSIQLVIRAHSGFSKRLNKYARRMEASGKKKALTALVIGPYGHQPRWEIFETLVLISASTGASYTLPVLENVLHSTATSCIKRVDFLLVARQGEEVSFYHERLREATERAKTAGIELTVHIAVTGDGQLEVLKGHPFSSSSVSTSSQEKKAYEEEIKVSANVEGVAQPLMSRSRKRFSNMSSDSHLYHSASRPDVAGFIQEAVEGTGGETGVVVCAGQSLVAKVRTSVAKLSDERAVHKGTGAQGIYLHVEEYCF